LTRENRFCNTVRFIRHIPPFVTRSPSSTKQRLLGFGTFAVFVAAAAGLHGAAAAEHLFNIGPLPVTNSMVTGLVVSALLVALIVIVGGRGSLVPGKAQAVLETVIEALRGILEPIVGRRAFPASFPLLATFFVFILVHNWMGLLPGVGTVGWGHEVDGQFHVFRPLVRPHNADFNSTIALAAVSFGAWLIIVFKYAGPKVILFDLFGNKAEKGETPGWLYPILAIVFLMVGFIEVFSIMIRPFTLSVRLFGNVYGGENLLHDTNFFFLFYFMELLVGLIQALVFTLLTAVYIGLICNHGDDHEHESVGGPAGSSSH
jgi:F-type H+-transporting ATPase subunit a